MLCLRLAALYKGVRWVTWCLWIGYAIFHGIRVILTLYGIITTVSESICIGSDSEPTFSYLDTTVYSSIGKQCLVGITGHVESPVPGYLAVVAPSTFDVFLLLLTIVKAFRNTILFDSYASSKVVCVAFDSVAVEAGFKYIPLAAQAVARRTSVSRTASITHPILICPYHRYFFIIVSQP